MPAIAQPSTLQTPFAPATPEQVDYLQALDASNPLLRSDLRIAREILNGHWPDQVRFSVRRGSLGHPLMFEIGNTHVWRAFSPSMNYQVADLVNGRYTDHRGRALGLRQTLNAVLEQKGLPAGGDDATGPLSGQPAY
jgi:hypothetical protein